MRKSYVPPIAFIWLGIVKSGANEIFMGWQRLDFLQHCESVKVKTEYYGRSLDLSGGESDE